jgi:hypothetical protein
MKLNDPPIGQYDISMTATPPTTIFVPASFPQIMKRGPNNGLAIHRRREVECRSFHSRCLHFFGRDCCRSRFRRHESSPVAQQFLRLAKQTATDFPTAQLS